MILHTVNKTLANSDALLRGLELSTQGAGLLLIEDGVLNAVKLSKGELLLREHVDRLAIYALREDCQARGIIELLPAYIALVDYAGFVSLTESHEKILSWF